jgi:hypothetical protein
LGRGGIEREEGDGMSDFPDFYTDGYALGVGPYGITLTLLASQPPAEEGLSAVNTPVARLRMSKEFARELAAALNKGVQTQAIRGRQTGTPN